MGSEFEDREEVGVEIFLVDLDEQLPRPLWAALVKRRAQFLCERCSSNKKLVSHHKDRNKENNCLRNGECLCRTCHSREHWEDNSERISRIKSLKKAQELASEGREPGWQNIGWQSLSHEERSEAVKKSWETRRARA